MTAETTNSRQAKANTVKVHVGRTLDGSGDQQIDLNIYCPAKNLELTLDECRDCEFHGGVSKAIAPGEAAGWSPEGAKRAERRHVIADKQRVTCNHPLLQQASAPLAPQPTAGDRTPVAAVMTRSVLCVRPDVSVEALTALLLERGLSGVPVVNERGRPMGMISKTDLIRVEYHDGQTEEHVRSEMGPGFQVDEIARTTVGEIMTPLVLKVEATDTLSQAAALMAAQRVHRVPVVRQGAVIGMLSAIDVMRWLGEQDGYLYPDR